MPYLDKDAILDSLTKKDVINIMNDLGVSTYKTGSNEEIIFPAICHHSNSYKLYYYHKATDKYPPHNFHCYSQCSCNYSIISLVQHIKKSQGTELSFYDALMYIANYAGHTHYLLDKRKSVKLIEDFSFIRKFKKRNEWKLPVFESINPCVLQLFASYPYEGWLEEGISKSVMQEFEIGYFGRDHAIVIPHRDINGMLIGIRERFIDQIDVDNIGKYVPICIQGKFLRHSLGETFYGIWQNQHAIKRIKKVILFEGEKSVLLAHSYMGSEDISLATCGSNLTTTQIKILLEVLKVEEVIFAYDREYQEANTIKADAYRNKLYKLIKRIINKCNVSVIWDEEHYISYKESPVDRGKETFLYLLEHRKRIIASDLGCLHQEL